MLNKLLKALLNEEFQHQGEHGLIVWYDAGGTLESIVKKSLPEGVNLLQFEGSYLALRFTLEEKDPNFEKKWLVYIPEEPPEPSWLRDWELMGIRLEMDLLGLLQKRCNLSITQKLNRLLREKPENSRELVSRWNQVIGNRPVTEEALIEALLAICFNLIRFNLQDAILKFITEEKWQKRLKELGLSKNWQKKIIDWTGWSEIPKDDTLFKKQLEATILLSELALSAPELTSHWNFVPQEKDRLEEIAKLAKEWRERESMRNAYCKSALRIEQEYELSNLLTLSEEFLNAETFRLFDGLWQRELRCAISPDGGNFTEKANRLIEISETRRKLFWARWDKNIGKFWESIHLASRTQKSCLEALESLKELSTVEAFISHYTDEKGWWQMDLWVLRLASLTEHLSAEDRKRFLRPVWVTYGNYLDRVNRSFAEAIKREGWKSTFKGFWERIAKEGKRKAIFFVDALRYDLAQYLKERIMEMLGEQVLLTMKHLQTPLPSITELGMSALLPDVETLSVGLQEGKLVVQIRNESILNRSEREAWLKRYLGRQGKILSLDELEREEIENIKLLVVFSREVDQFGTFVADLYPEGLLDMVDRIVRAVRYITENGFERIYLVADHGFLFIPSDIQPNLIEAPRGSINKRRFAIGAGAGGYLLLRSEELGLQGREVFAFPTGFTVFALQGEIGKFLHGGLSLQESIVPMLEITVKRMIQRVSVRMELPVQLTSRVASIPVKVVDAKLFQKPRRIIVEINGKRSEPVELNIENQKAVVSLSWLDFDESPPREATIRLIDADSGQILQEGSTNVSIVV